MGRRARQGEFLPLPGFSGVISGFQQRQSYTTPPTVGVYDTARVESVGVHLNITGITGAPSPFIHLVAFTGSPVGKAGTMMQMFYPWCGTLSAHEAFEQALTAGRYSWFFRVYSPWVAVRMSMIHQAGGIKLGLGAGASISFLSKRS